MAEQPVDLKFTADPSEAVDAAKKVQNEKRNSKSIKENMSRPNHKKDMVFKFGAEARKTAMESKESKKEDKISKQFKCEKYFG